MQSFYYFPSGVYALEAPEFLERVNKVSESELSKVPVDLNEIYPARQSNNYASNPEVSEFANFISSTAINILAEQGYKTEVMVPNVEAMWTQEHHKHSLMEQHTHAWTTLVGFYFLDVPEGSSRALYHDPRPGKTMMSLVEANEFEASPASNIVNFEPKKGLILLSNGWLPHSFSRHTSDEALKFVHFNVSIGFKAQEPGNISAEVI